MDYKLYEMYHNPYQVDFYGRRDFRKHIVNKKSLQKPVNSSHQKQLKDYAFKKASTLAAHSLPSLIAQTIKL